MLRRVQLFVSDSFFPMEEYWGGKPFPSLGDLSDLGMKPGPPALRVDSSPSEPPQLDGPRCSPTPLSFPASKVERTVATYGAVRTMRDRMPFLGLRSGPTAVGSIPGLGRSLGEGNVSPLQYSCLENSMDRGAWWATVHEVAKSWTRLGLHSLTTVDSVLPVKWPCI